MPDITESTPSFHHMAEALGKIRDSIDAAIAKFEAISEPSGPSEASAVSSRQASDDEVQHWKRLAETLRDIASERPDISERRGKEAWQSTALLQSSMLSEIHRLCSENLRSTTIGARPIGVTMARGRRTQAVAERDGSYINVSRTLNGTQVHWRVFEPSLMDLTPALTDLLVLTLED